MDIRTEDHQYPLYLPALPFGRAMSYQPSRGIPSRPTVHGVRAFGLQKVKQ